MNSGILAKLFFIALVFLLPFTSSAQNTPHTVNSYNALQNAITAANVDLDADTINITSDITIAFDINTIFSPITINGNGHTIYGADTHSAITTSGSHVNLTIKNLTFAENQGAAGSHGGAINHQGGSLTLDNVTIRDSATSHATADGGGLICSGPNLTIRNSRIHDNSGRKGGGIYLHSSCTNAQITNSSIYDNESTGNGAGIFVAAGVTISNSSIFGNTSGHRGGGIYIDGGTATLNHVTIAGNTTTNAQGSASSETGAGLRAHGGTLNMRNSIVYDNIFSGNQENCRIGSSVTVSTLSNNIVGGGSDATCTASQTTDDPDLAGPGVHRLGSFYIPRANSPAIDAVTCLASSVDGYNVDQRGQPRPRTGQTNSECDIGAIEHPGYVPPPPPSSDRGDDGGGDGDGDGASTSESNAPPPTTCETLDGVQVEGNGASPQCQRLDAMKIAKPDMKDDDFVDAVDVWSWVSPDTEVCFEASGGSVRFIDTAAMPRTTSEPQAYSKDGMTCAKISGPGIVILLPGDPPAGAAPQAAAAPTSAPAPAQSLSNCMVKTNEVLKFRESPGGSLVIRDWIPNSWLPKESTLTAVERTDGWFKVDYYGVKGWISADYVEKKGNCG